MLLLEQSRPMSVLVLSLDEIVETHKEEITNKKVGLDYYELKTIQKTTTRICMASWHL